MPANVETMMYRKDGGVPWHGLGKPVHGALNSKQAMVEAGADWEVALRPLYMIQGAENGDHEAVPVEANAVVRLSDGKVVCDHIGPRFTPLQNVDAFTWFDPFIESGAAQFDTAGVLQDGRKVWILARLNTQPIQVVKGDDIVKYLMLSNSHDGSMAVRVAFTPVRVVCCNTLAMAHRADGTNKFLRLRHTKSMHEALEKVREVTNAANQEFEATAEQYRALARKQVNKSDLRRYVKQVLEYPENEKDISSRSLNVLESILVRHDRQGEVMSDLLRGGKNQQKALAAASAGLLENIVEKFETGRGTQDLPGAARSSYWTCYNAVNEFLNYDYGRSQDSRLASLWFGEGANINQRALSVALQMATGGT